MISSMSMTMILKPCGLAKAVPAAAKEKPAARATLTRAKGVPTTCVAAKDTGHHSARSALGLPACRHEPGLDQRPTESLELPLRRKVGRAAFSATPVKGLATGLENAQTMRAAL